MTARTPRRPTGGRALAAVLAAAVAAGVLLSLVVLRLGQNGSGSASPTQQVTAPRLHALPGTVAGEEVTTVAAGIGSLAYGTVNGDVYLSSGHSEPRRLTVLKGRVVKLAFDPGARWLAAASINELAVADTAHPATPVVHRPVRTYTPLGAGLIRPNQLAIDRTGHLLALQTDLIGVYDLHGNGSPHWLEQPYDECEAGARDLAFVGSELIAAYDNCANFFNAATLRMERQVNFPGTGNALVGHGRILYSSFTHALLLDYRRTSPLPSASAVPGQPHPVLSGVIADKTISTRHSPIQPVADDGRAAAVLQDTRLFFWEPTSHRILAVVTLPFPVICPNTTKPPLPAQFATSFSPDHKRVLISGYCPPPPNIDGDTDEGQRHATYRHWEVDYPSG
ncbi:MULTISPECIES: hypothetical protein [unclassified Streptomyces]|uniref:hypothetical protein n=1 Tax=unclassified Streptomyces TaxID=2593676 RepID=UPI00131A27A8|nr:MULTISPECIES: hypothetical protein [unclassified Streptomyces]MYT33763.1 hypothetical protein [Streptomyces sp. SID8354]